MKKRYFLHLAYNGKAYHGWQIQENALTIQEVVTTALSNLLQQEIEIVGCGRTDTGVHAKDYYAHFDTKENLDREKRDKLCFKLNRFLSEDIVIYDILPVNKEAHARFDAVTRTYQYDIVNIKNPFKNKYTYYVYGKINVEKMNKAAEHLLHYSDFTSFSKTGTQTKTNNCKIHYAFWQKDEEGIIRFTIKADRFLRNMVRAIVGTLIDVGIGKITVEQFCKIIESKSRSNAGYSVPAQALFLTEVNYPKEIFIEGGFVSHYQKKN